MILNIGGAAAWVDVEVLLPPGPKQRYRTIVQRVDDNYTQVGRSTPPKPLGEWGVTICTCCDTPTFGLQSVHMGGHLRQHPGGPLNTPNTSPGVDCRQSSPCGGLSAGSIRRIFGGRFEMPCAEWYTRVDGRRLSTVELKFSAVDSRACPNTPCPNTPWLTECYKLFVMYYPDFRSEVDADGCYK
eukprot:9496299-Pyramimonas_sp.AAC.2